MPQAIRPKRGEVAIKGIARIDAVRRARGARRNVAADCRGWRRGVSESRRSARLLLNRKGAGFTPRAFNIAAVPRFDVPEVGARPHLPDAVGRGADPIAVERRVRSAPILYIILSCATTLFHE